MLISCWNFQKIQFSRKLQGSYQWKIKQESREYSGFSRFPTPYPESQFPKFLKIRKLDNLESGSPSSLERLGAGLEMNWCMSAHWKCFITSLIVVHNVLNNIVISWSLWRYVISTNICCVKSLQAVIGSLKTYPVVFLRSVFLLTLTVLYFNAYALWTKNVHSLDSSNFALMAWCLILVHCYKHLLC